MIPSLRTISARFRRLPWVLAGNAFWLTIALIIVSMFAAVLLYVFEIAAPSRPIPEAVLPPPLRKDLFAEILQEWVRREQVLREPLSGSGVRNVFLRLPGQSN